MSRISWIKPEDMNAKVDHDRMAGEIGVRTLNDADDHFGWWEADIPPDLDGEGDYPTPERDALWKKYETALESVFEDLLEKHHLEMRRQGKYGWKIFPKTTWDAAADEIRQTINGVGEFDFPTLRAFLESGPYTARAAVLTHLHWMKRWWEVYEGAKASSIFDRRLR